MDTARRQSRVLHKTTRRYASPGPSGGLTTGDSWLSTDGVTKLSPEESHTWRRNTNKSHTSRGLWITNIVLRAVSMISAFIVAVISLKLLSGIPYTYERVDFIWIIVPGIIIFVWDMAEFILVYRRKRGLPGTLHMFADALFSLTAVTAIVLTWVAHYYGIFGYQWDAILPGVDSFTLLMALTVFLALILIVHSSCFLILCCHGGGNLPYSPDSYTPRVMYLPTGEPVVVLPRPLPTKASRQPRRQPPPVVDIYDLADIDGPRVASPIQERIPPRAAPQPSQNSPILERPSRHVSSHRNHVSGPSPIGTHYATPWPPGHEPDAAERARAARGEAQAQWMTLAGSSIRPEKGIRALGKGH